MTTTTAGADQNRLIAKRVTDFIRSGLDRPLSEDDRDIFYPSSDGEPLAESDLQFTPLTETVHTLRRRYRDRSDVYVAGNLLVYYRMNDNEVRVAPDVLVVFGVEDYPRDSYIVWREDGKTPDFVMEVASPSTYTNDMTEKRNIYAALGVAEYWRFDPTGKLFSSALEGEQLADGEYQPIPIDLNVAGILRGRSAVLELDICVRPELQLRLYDPTTGTWLRNLEESEDALAETQDALAETNRQNEAQAARIRELEAQLRQQGIEPPAPSP
jgi:Uma2 family endonuclease